MRKRVLFTCIVVAAGLLLNLESDLAARDRVKIMVDPTVAVPPATLRVRTVVEPDESNRALEVVVDSAEFYSSSELRLDGEHASRVNALTLRDLPAGEYRVTATLTTADGQHWVAIKQIQVRTSLIEFPTMTP
jgi:hypothetical protein